MNAGTENEENETQSWLAELKLEHRSLDDMIDRLSEDRLHNRMQMQRLKKRKLRLKDMITRLESKLIPDLDA